MRNENEKNNSNLNRKTQENKHNKKVIYVTTKVMNTINWLQ